MSAPNCPAARPFGLPFDSARVRVSGCWCWIGLRARAPALMLSHGARDELDRLLAKGDGDQLREMVSHLRPSAIAAWPLPSDEGACEETAVLFEARMGAREERAAVHRNRLGAAAYRLGQRVAAHEVTLDDAYRQLARLVDAHDPELSVPVRLASYDDARSIARDAFGRGMRAKRTRRESA